MFSWLTCSLVFLYSTAKLDEDDEEVAVDLKTQRVVTTVFPGFQIDGSIEKVDLLYADTGIVQQLPVAGKARD